MIIIPAIDIINGKAVRLTKGDYAQQKVYNENPVEVAKQFEAAGIERLHIVDLDGAKAGKIINLKVLEEIATATNLVIDFGGGVKNINDVGNIFNAGAAMVTVGSLAVKHPELLEEWLMEFSAEKFLVGADVLDEKIKISGWLEDGGINIFDFIGKMISLGTTNIFCTDISKDGMLEGPSFELYKRILEQTGASLANVVDLTVFLVDMENYAEFNQVYNEYFDQSTGPTRTTVAVKQLPNPRLLIEIKATALAPQ